MEKNRILIADDNLEIQERLKGFLNDISNGYEIVIVNEGGEALKKIQEELFYLVFVDFELPGTNGLYVYLANRQIYGTKRSKVIILTNDPRTLMREAKKKAPGNKAICRMEMALLKKDFDYFTLVKTIGNVIGW